MKSECLECIGKIYVSLLMCQSSAFWCSFCVCQVKQWTLASHQNQKEFNKCRKRLLQLSNVLVFNTKMLRIIFVLFVKNWSEIFITNDFCFLNKYSRNWARKKKHHKLWWWNLFDRNTLTFFSVYMRVSCKLIILFLQATFK